MISINQLCPLLLFLLLLFLCYSWYILEFVLTSRALSCDWRRGYHWDISGIYHFYNQRNSGIFGREAEKYIYTWWQYTVWRFSISVYGFWSYNVYVSLLTMKKKGKQEMVVFIAKWTGAPTVSVPLHNCQQMCGNGLVTGEWLVSMSWTLSIYNYPFNIAIENGHL